MGTNMAIWEHRIFLPFLFIFIFVLSLNCLSTKGVVKKYIFPLLRCDGDELLFFFFLAKGV